MLRDRASGRVKGTSPIFDVFNNRDKATLDIFWLRDEGLEESDNLPHPNVLAQEIVEDLETALEQFREIAAELGPKVRATGEGCETFTQP
jgi:type I restriction enzyme M protein